MCGPSAVWRLHVATDVPMQAYGGGRRFRDLDVQLSTQPGPVLSC